MSPRTRLLGIDYGRVRVGLAVSDVGRCLASPLETYQRRGPESDARYFKGVIEREEVGGLVIGLPVHVDGRDSPMAREVRAFGGWLQRVTGLPTAYWDERFSSVEAESALWEAGLTHKRRKQRRDRVAAQMFLQAYLDAGCPEETEPKRLDG